MSKFFLFSKINNPEKKKLNLDLNRKSLKILAIVLIIVLGISYLGFVNTTTKESFVVDDLERQVKELKEKNEKLEIEISELLSMQNVKRASESFNLIAAKKVDYLSGSSIVALSEWLKDTIPANIIKTK